MIYSPDASPYEYLHFYDSPKSLTLEPGSNNPSSNRESLVISRDSSQIEIHSTSSSLLQSAVHTVVYGILGIISLNIDYLILITSRKRVCRLMSVEIYKMDGYMIVPIQQHAHMSTRAKNDDLTYLKMLEMVLELDYYFSYSFDLTRSLKQKGKFEYGQSVPMYRRCEEQFYWNYHISQKLTQVVESISLSGASTSTRFILPVICGFISSYESVTRDPFQYVLISRRSTHRAGTRYHSRGIDELGNVSNFVETEQLVITPDGTTRSYLQIRGSIPLFWEQQVGFKYKPKLVLHNRAETSLIFKQHYASLKHSYGPQIMINLINTSGYEGPLGEEFLNQVSAMNDSTLRYIHFDFHTQCKNMRWDRISILINELEQDLNLQGYSLMNADRKLVQVQSSIVRTNCIDCLDRTNVVQSILARRVLELQLKKMGVLMVNENLETMKEFYFKFRNSTEY